MIELSEVSKSFVQGGAEIQALLNTNFQAERGELIAIVGPSGSGKSTLLSIMGGLQRPSHGSVRIDGKDLTSLSDTELARMRLNTIGFILQSSSLVPYLTVLEQLVLHFKVTKAEPDMKRCHDLMSRLDIARLENKYPEQLSGGERQRTAIAAALVHHPSVILADEPTAALDTSRAFDIAKLLGELAHDEQCTTIMVTHDERLTKYCDSVYRMSDGRLNRQ